MRGFSTIELVMVVAILVVAAAIAIPLLRPASDFAELETAAASVRRAIDQAVGQARSGSTVHFTPATSIPGCPESISINPKWLTPPMGTAVGSIDWQGGTGYPYVDGQRQPVAIVVANAERTHAVAWVVSPSGVVTRYDGNGDGWRVSNENQ